MDKRLEYNFFKVLMLFMFVLICVCCLLPYYVKANVVHIKGNYYENSENDGFNRNNPKTEFSYSNQAIVKNKGIYGYFNEVENTYRDGFPVYSLTGELTFYYNYESNKKPKPYMDGVKEHWNIKSSDEETIDGYDVGHDIDEGAIIVLKSSDGQNWDNVIDPFYDFFDDYDPTEKSYIFKVSEKDVVDGMFYKVLVAYRMEKKIDSGTIVLNCLEEYKFFLCSEVNHTIVKDIKYGNNITGSYSIADAGFIVEKGGDNLKLTVGYVEKNYKEEITEKNRIFTKVGGYNIRVYNCLGKEVFRTTIIITDGSVLQSVKANIYETDDEYNKTNANMQMVFGNGKLTDLSIIQQGDTDIDVGYAGSWQALGIRGESVSLYFKLLRNPNNLGNGWKIEPDDYGKKMDKHEINGVHMGKIDKGALIVRISRDGNNWVYVNDTDNKYSNGLFTTNYTEYYKEGQNVQIYTPLGEDLIKGLYVNVCFAYKVRNDSSKEEKNYIEEYDFYLCNNNLEGVTIHNLTVRDSLINSIGTDNEVLLEMYKYAESMESGSGTTTGFTIDNRFVPSAKIEVYRDATSDCYELDRKYTEDGKYHITITSPMGTKREVNIYVDKSSKNKLMEEYFGSYNFYMKKIYVKESEYPIYESGVSFFRYINIGLGSDKMAIRCTVKRDGEIVKEYGYTRKLTDIPIDKAGEYELEFIIASEEGNEESGDVRKFRFRFKAIENTEATKSLFGPKINKEYLYNTYGKQFFQDYLPIYYGVKRGSSGKGDFIVAFASEKAALTYARDVEHGMVEKIENGYRYRGEYAVKKKEIYTDGFDLAEAEEEFARQIVQKSYFDFSDYTSFSTLKEGDFPKYNEETGLPESIPYLDKGVVVFYNEEEKELLYDADGLPLINDKNNYYIIPGKDKVEIKPREFMFINKLGGIDSAEVFITDINGKKYDIEYDKSVEQQLIEKGCPSGIVKITEKTIDKKSYWEGDSCTYEALYIAPNDIESEILLNLVYSDGRVEKTIITKEIIQSVEDGELYEIHTDKAVLNSFSDVLDNHALLIVRTIDDMSRYEDIGIYLANGEDIDLELAYPDTYYIKCVNRAGYSFEFKLIIDDSDIADTIRIELHDSKFNLIPSESSVINIKYGDDSSKLPMLLEHEGYDFVGFYDPVEKIIYSSSDIKQIVSDGYTVLEAQWHPQKVNVSFEYQDGRIIEYRTVEYDSIISFPDYDFEADGYELVSWIFNGEQYDENAITVNSIENMIFIAEVKEYIIPTNVLTPTEVAAPTDILNPTEVVTPIEILNPTEIITLTEAISPAEESASLDKKTSEDVKVSELKESSQNNNQRDRKKGIKSDEKEETEDENKKHNVLLIIIIVAVVGIGSGVGLILLEIGRK